MTVRTEVIWISGTPLIHNGCQKIQYTSQSSVELAFLKRIGKELNTPELDITQNQDKDSREPTNYHIFPPSKPPCPIIAADVFASKNSSFISPMSSASI